MQILTPISWFEALGISVIFPVYNEKSTVAEIIASVPINHEAENIIVIDGSAENTLENPNQFH